MMNRQNPYKRVSWVFFSGLLLASPVVAADAVPADAASHAPSVAQAPRADAASRRFNVMEYQVAGNTVLPNLAIEQAVYPWLGESKTIDDIDHARASLEKAYRDAGPSPRPQRWTGFPSPPCLTPPSSATARP